MFKVLFARKILVLVFLAFLMGTNTRAQEALPKPKPVPRMQVIPMPYHQASFQRDGVELTRYHFGPGLHRPFLFPVIGQSGISLTRMGHPHDPESHSHHNSVWISHTRPCLARYDLQKLYPGITAQIFCLWQVAYQRHCVFDKGLGYAIAFGVNKFVGHRFCFFGHAAKFGAE